MLPLWPPLFCISVDSSGKRNCLRQHVSRWLDDRRKTSQKLFKAGPHCARGRSRAPRPARVRPSNTNRVVRVARKDACIKLSRVRRRRQGAPKRMCRSTTGRARSAGRRARRGLRRRRSRQAPRFQTYELTPRSCSTAPGRYAQRERGSGGAFHVHGLPRAGGRRGQSRPGGAQGAGGGADRRSSPNAFSNFSRTPSSSKSNKPSSSNSSAMSGTFLSN